MKQLELVRNFYHFSDGCYEVRLLIRDENEITKIGDKAIVGNAYATKIEMKEFDYQNPVDNIEPLFNLNKNELIYLMDQLWNLGIRPSNGSGDANAFEAVKYHLEDMRKLVFKEKDSDL